MPRLTNAMLCTHLVYVGLPRTTCEDCFLGIAKKEKKKKAFLASTQELFVTLQCVPELCKGAEEGMQPAMHQTSAG